jgi:hypothetical protein
MAHDIKLGEAFQDIDSRRTMNLGEQANRCGALSEDRQSATRRGEAE